MQLFTPSQYLKIDIASQFGLDKASWDERICWFDQNEGKLDDLVNKAENPALFFAGTRAWKDYKAGVPSGYPISLDATSSGLQLLAALTGDRKAAQLSNVIDAGQRNDAYTVVYEYMCSVLGDSVKIERSMTKDAIMTALYGSTAVPKRVFGGGKLLQVFYETMKTLAPGAWELNEIMLSLWNPTVLSNDWVLPDNFHVRIKVIDTVCETVHFLNEPYDTYHKVNQRKKTGRSLGANTIHSLDGMVVREMTRRCSYNPVKVDNVINALNHSWHAMEANENYEMTEILWNHYKKTGYLSARILDHIDHNNAGLVDKATVRDLIASLPSKPFQIMCVHDCFRCLPNYANDMRKQYNNQLKLIAKSDLLSSILTQLIGKHVKIEKHSPRMWQEIPHANYALS